MNDETFAYFFIEGFECDHSEVTHFLGLEPTEACNKGDVDGEERAEISSSWLLHSPLPKKTVFLDEHLETLLDILDTKSPEVLEMTRKYDCGINCIGKHFSPNPGVNLSKELIRRLGFFEISVDFDIYCNCEKCASMEVA